MNRKITLVKYVFRNTFAKNSRKIFLDRKDVLEKLNMYSLFPLEILVMQEDLERIAEFSWSVIYKLSLVVALVKGSIKDTSAIIVLERDYIQLGEKNGN